MDNPGYERQVKADGAYYGAPVYAEATVIDGNNAYTEGYNGLSHQQPPIPMSSAPMVTQPCTCDEGVYIMLWKKCTHPIRDNISA